MSGVIDKHGQWEHCNECGKFVLIQHLGYLIDERKRPTKDICVQCVDKGIRNGSILFKQVVPADSWIQTEE